MITATWLIIRVWLWGIVAIALFDLVSNTFYTITDWVWCHYGPEKNAGPIHILKKFRETVRLFQTKNAKLVKIQEVPDLDQELSGRYKVDYLGDDGQFSFHWKSLYQTSFLSRLNRLWRRHLVPIVFWPLLLGIYILGCIETKIYQVRNS
ncbi:MAG: hypothetical protein HY225_02950 [Candidatus Vogelbacteria bacterium]|nr:hypothetical protein [Candidatus Vogelbacteria bacterium]